MSKSKYPEKIDSSKELPIVKDDLLQLGAEAINSIRSAIIQIEKTLGINPNGFPGSTVSSRLDSSLDEYGQIKKSALDYLNLLKGPVENSDVSSDANIEESKLNLDFSTNFLYNQISSTYRNIIDLSNEVKEIASSLTAHLNRDAFNRHLAKNINVEEIISSSSNSSIKNSSEMDLQTLISLIFSSHINYSGVQISESNNSHSANQIFYNNVFASVLDSNNVQDAIDELSTGVGDTIKGHQGLMHSNGKIKFFKEEEILVSDITGDFLTYSYSDSEKGTEIVFSPEIDDPGLEKSDIVRINKLDIDYSFTISKINYSLSKISSIVVKEDVVFDSAGSSISLLKNPIKRASHSPVNIALREEITSNAHTLVCVEPKAPTILSERVNPKAINASNRFLKVEVGSKSYEVSCYDASISGDHTIDLIIKNINEDFSNLNAPLIAYRVEDSFSRVGISHILPHNGTRSIKLVAASDTAYSDLGLSDFLDKEVFGSDFHSFTVFGESNFSLKTKISDFNFEITASKTIDSFLSSPLSDFNIKKNDILIIEGSDSDDGAYPIDMVSDAYMVVRSLSNFSGQTLSNSVLFTIKENSLSLEDITFESLSGNDKSTVLQLYITENKDFISNICLEYQAINNSSNPIFQILDIKNISGETFSLNVKKENDSYFFENLNGYRHYLNENDGQKFYLISEYGDVLYFCIPEYSNFKNYIDSSGNETFECHTQKPLSHKNNFLAGVILYENFRGLVSGESGVYRSERISPFGNIDRDNISDNFIEEFFDNFRKHSRGNGILYGCELYNVISNSDNNYEISISYGKVLVGGKEVEVSPQTIDTKKTASSLQDILYVAIDKFGNIKFELGNSPSASCQCPFSLTEFTVIAVVNWSPTFIETIDLRVFLNESLSYNVNEVHVNADKSRLNFRSINSAFKYAKTISKVSNRLGTPKIIFSPGIHENTITHESTTYALRYDDSTFQTQFEKIYDEGIYIDFPVIIEGCGDSSILSFMTRWSDTPDSATNEDVENIGKIVIAGENIDAAFIPDRTSASKISGPVKFKNLTLKNTQIFICDNFNQTKNSSIETSASVEFSGVKFEKTNYSDDDNTVVFFTAKDLTSYTYFVNRCIFDSCRFEDANIRFKDKTPFSIHTKNSTNASSVSSITIRSSSFIFSDLASSVLISLNSDHYNSEKIYGLNMFDNSYSDGLYLFKKSVGIYQNPYFMMQNLNDHYIDTTGDIALNSDQTAVLQGTNAANISSDSIINLLSKFLNIYTTDLIQVNAGNTINISADHALTLESTNNFAKVKGFTYSELSLDNSSFSTNHVKVQGNDCEVKNSGNLNLDSHVKFLDKYYRTIYKRFTVMFPGTDDICLGFQAQVSSLTTSPSDTSGNFITDTSLTSSLAAYLSESAFNGIKWRAPADGRIKSITVINGFSSTCQLGVGFLYHTNNTTLGGSSTSWTVASSWSTPPDMSFISVAATIGPYETFEFTQQWSLSEGYVYCLVALVDDPSAVSFEIELEIEYYE